MSQADRHLDNRPSTPPEICPSDGLSVPMETYSGDRLPMSLKICLQVWQWVQGRTELECELGDPQKRASAADDGTAALLSGAHG